MGTLLQVIGFGWALLGFGNLVGMFSKDIGQGLQILGLMFNVLLFILPGLVVGGLGTVMNNRRKAATEAAGTEEQRIAAAVSKALEAERNKRPDPDWMTGELEREKTITAPNQPRRRTSPGSPRTAWRTAEVQPRRPAARPVLTSRRTPVSYGA